MLFILSPAQSIKGNSHPCWEHVNNQAGGQEDLVQTIDDTNQKFTVYDSNQLPANFWTIDCNDIKGQYKCTGLHLCPDISVPMTLRMQGIEHQPGPTWNAKDGSGMVTIESVNVTALATLENVIVLATQEKIIATPTTRDTAS